MTMTFFYIEYPENNWVKLVSLTWNQMSQYAKGYSTLILQRKLHGHPGLLLAEHTGRQVQLSLKWRNWGCGRSCDSREVTGSQFHSCLSWQRNSPSAWHNPGQASTLRGFTFSFVIIYFTIWHSDDPFTGNY